MNTPPGTGPFTLTAYGYTCNGAFGSQHLGGALFVFADGNTRFFDESIDLSLYRALSTRGRGEAVSPP